MKHLKIALLSASLMVSAVGHSNVINSLPTGSRYESMDIATLSNEASKNNHHAQFYLAMRLQKGIGVPQDAEKAVYWYTRAAENNIAPAQLNLGIMYLGGKGVKADLEKGRAWLERAAHLGDNRASYALAMIDEKQERLVDAYKWYDLSSRNGMLDPSIRDKAQAKIGKLALNLSSDDLQKAKSSANDWFEIK